MAHYYFDWREGDELITDEEGLELRGMRAVQNEAARSLAGFAWDSVARFDHREGAMGYR
jgi:Domain of unknown function (DUF6894)